MKKLIMIKFGGAILTDKSRPCTIRQPILENIVSQLHSFLSISSHNVILGNGGGSFGHYYAKMYSLNQGINNTKSLLGMCRGKNGNSYLNMKLVECLNNNKITACSYPIDEVFSRYGVSKNEYGIDSWKRLISYLDSEIIPVVYGDIVFDKDVGCKIVSTEDIFLALGKMFNENVSCGYQIEKIIFCTDKDGVEDKAGRVIPFINKEEFNQWEIFTDKEKRYDMTGGMYEKVKMSIKKELLCPVYIINGMNPENLFKTLRGEKNLGTVIY